MTGLRCVNDDGNTAVGVCTVCSDAVCEQCAGVSEADAVVCRECAYEQALGGVAEHRAHKEEAAAVAAEAAEQRPGFARIWGGRAALATCVGILTLWSGPQAVTSFADPPPYAVGAVGEDDEDGLYACIEGLWQVRAGFDEYVYRHDRTLPESLAEVQGIPQRCPGCDGAWTYENQASGAYRIACPNPEAHGRGEISLDNQVGPPHVRSEGP